MTARYLAIGLVWVVSLVGVGLWAQAPVRDVDTSMQLGRATPTQGTGTVEGRVEDRTGGTIPGATVNLISETSGVRSTPVVTDRSGVYLFRNVAPDTYTVEVNMPGFRTLRRPGVVVTDGSRVAVLTVALEVWAGAPTVPIPQMPLPGTGGAIISGEDIGFQPVYSSNTPPGAVTGRWMVRVNGEWLVASTPFQAVPAR